MLDSLRKNSQSFLVKAMLAAIVVVFVFWGVGSFQARQLEVVARVNGDVISAQEFDRAYENTQRALAQNLPAGLPEAVLRERTLDQLITMRLVQQEAQRLGLMVTAEEVRDSIATIPEFQNNGQFDRDLYLRLLRANALTPAGFEASHREDLLLKKLQDIIVAGAHVTEAQARDRFRYDNEQVGLKVLKVATADFLSRVELTDEEVRAHFDENRERFREPERVKIRYVFFGADHFSAAVEPTEEEIHNHYEENTDRYRRPEEEVRVEIVETLKRQSGRQAALKQAEEAHERLLDGEDLNALAAAVGLTVVDSPPFSAQEPVTGLPSWDEVREAAFAAEAGEAGDIATLESGYVVFVVTERKESYLPEFDAAREKAEQELRERRAREAARRRAEELLAKLTEAPSSLEAIAVENGLTVEQTGPFRRTAGYIGKIGDVPELREAAFQLTAEKPVAPAVYEVDSGALVAVFDERLPAEEQEFEERKDNLVELERRRLEMALVGQFVNYLKGKAEIEYGQAYTAQGR